MRGRPPKFGRENPEVRLNITVPASIRYKIPENVNISELIRLYLSELFEDPKKFELSELEKKEQELKEQLVIVQQQILTLKRQIEEQEKIRKNIELKNLYAVFSFWKILRESAKSGSLSFHGNTYPEKILGIKFNYSAVEDALKKREIQQYSIETFEQAIELAQQYSVRYIGNGERENEKFEEFLNFYNSWQEKIRGVKNEV